MDWASRRKIIYGSSFVLVIIALSLFIFRDTLFPQPTCSDGEKNGFEVDVDCGGNCILRCKSEVIPLSVVWSRALQTNPDTYDFVALVANKNINNAPRTISYSFTAYDSNGQFILKKSGTTPVPVEDDMPIIVQNIVSYTRPEKVVLTIDQAPHYLAREKANVPPVRVVTSVYEPGETSRVYVRIQNTRLTDLFDVPVRIVLYDENQNAIAAGESLVERLEGEEEKTLVYTWTHEFTQKVARIRVYPVFSAFLTGQ